MLGGVVASSALVSYRTLTAGSIWELDVRLAKDCLWLLLLFPLIFVVAIMAGIGIACYLWATGTPWR
jgi:prepilin signal peptidase PulO-like enzyme (type II secretory pathway)